MSEAIVSWVHRHHKALVLTLVVILLVALFVRFAW